MPEGSGNKGLSQKPTKPFVKLPQDEGLARRLSDGAYKIYCLLLSHARQRDFCWPSQETLSEESGRNKRSVQRDLAELSASGLIIAERRGLGRSNKYRLAETTPVSHQETTPVSHQETTPVSHQETTPVSHHYTVREEDITELDTKEGAAAFFPSSGQLPKGKAMDEKLASWERWNTAWEALREEDRASIRLQMQQQRPLFATQGEGSYAFHSACLQELEQRTRSKADRKKHTSPRPKKGSPSAKPIVPAGIELPAGLDDPAFAAAWKEWCLHRQQIRKRLTPLTIKKQLAQLSKFGKEIAIASINQSIERGWTGLFEPDGSGPAVRSNCRIRTTDRQFEAIAGKTRMRNQAAAEARAPGDSSRPTALDF